MKSFVADDCFCQNMSTHVIVPEPLNSHPFISQIWSSDHVMGVVITKQLFEGSKVSDHSHQFVPDPFHRPIIMALIGIAHAACILALNHYSK